MLVARAVVMVSLVGGCARSAAPVANVPGGGPAVEVQEFSDGARLPSGACRGIDTQQDFGRLNEQALVTYLRAEGFVVRIERARTDLVYVDLARDETAGGWLRLRVAILPSAELAGEELHRALLQHGTGAWGVHRANLAVLASASPSVDRTVSLAGRAKLACWGVLTIAGLDDAFVVPGGYAEF